MTTAGQIMSSAQLLIDQVAKVNAAIAVIDRDQGGESNLASVGIKLRSLLSENEVLSS